MISRGELATLSLRGLAETWQLVQQTRTKVGLKTEAAVARSTIERRIRELLASSDHTDETSVECEVVAKIETRGAVFESGRLRLRAGGLEFPKHVQLKELQEVTLELRNENNHPLRLKCVVGKVGKSQLGLYLKESGDSGERRVQRLITALLEAQVQ